MFSTLSTTTKHKNMNEHDAIIVKKQYNNLVQHNALLKKVR